MNASQYPNDQTMVKTDGARALVFDPDVAFKFLKDMATELNFDHLVQTVFPDPQPSARDVVSRAIHAYKEIYGLLPGMGFLVATVTYIYNLTPLAVFDEACMKRFLSNQYSTLRARDATDLSTFILATRPGFTLTNPTFGLHRTPLTHEQKEDNMKHAGTLLRYTLTKPYLFMNSPDDVCGPLIIHNIFTNLIQAKFWRTCLPSCYIIFH